MGIRVLIDDNPKTLMAAKEAGMDALRIDWPYNEHLVGVPYGDRLTSVLGYGTFIAGLV